ncbi:DUF3426 domain-containing protein [Variovorax terrae]|uniref:DUF3426 domain-containing protein n=1 Tax=Variovorax terrae TaxID=2923278 RepID=A0A9X1VRJ3_9BURK|nr:DUF3426 domain-containing protein [Variovorax terrae]MCJ0762013.1 DUF3426 domain-containing protein [Variovorax terrae]
MSLITRCPACATMFKVVPDQLRISEGWVRCGHCTEVFDAALYLQTDVPPAPAAEPTSVPHGEVMPPVAQVPEPEPVEHEPELAPAPAAPAAEVFPATDAPVPVVKLVPDELEEAAPSQPAVLQPETRTEEAVQETRVDEVVAASAPIPPAEEPEQALHDVSFVREARRKAFWRRPLVRTALALVCLALLSLLALQVAVQERDRVAALEPRARPWLMELCAPLQCSVAPLRQIESIVIDSSSFNKMRGDAYRLSFTLKNTAPMALALPAIELALTDTQDQPVLRRVLQPAELGAAPAVLGAGGEWTGSFAVSVAGNGNGAARIAGYRMLAFYP